MEVESSKAAEAAAQPSTSRMVNGNNSKGLKPDTALKPEPAGAAVGAEGWEKEIPEVCIHWVVIWSLFNRILPRYIFIIWKKKKVMHDCILYDMTGVGSSY